MSAIAPGAFAGLTSLFSLCGDDTVHCNSIYLIEMDLFWSYLLINVTLTWFTAIWTTTSSPPFPLACSPAWLLSMRCTFSPSCSWLDIILHGIWPHLLLLGICPQALLRPSLLEHSMACQRSCPCMYSVYYVFYVLMRGRYIQSNKITSIPSNAFANLASISIM